LCCLQEIKSEKEKITMSLQFLPLEAIQEFGIPAELDEIALTKRQCKAFASIVDKLMEEAGHPKEFALTKAARVFRLMYEQHNGKWKALQKIKLTGHGDVVVRNKFYKAEHREQVVQKVKEAMKGERGIVETIMEAGRRNSGKDKEAVKTALSSLITVLNPTDQEEILKAIRKKLGGGKIKLKGAKK